MKNTAAGIFKAIAHHAAILDLNAVTIDLNPGVRSCTGMVRDGRTWQTVKERARIGTPTRRVPGDVTPGPTAHPPRAPAMTKIALPIAELRGQDRDIAGDDAAPPRRGMRNQSGSHADENVRARPPRDEQGRQHEQDKPDKDGHANQD